MPLEERCGVICVHDTKLLLVQGVPDTINGRLIDPRWGFPKGFHETGESFAKTAARELFEETGIKVTKKQLTSAPRIDIHRSTCGEIMYLYVLELDDKPEVKTNPLEIQNYGWFSPTDINKLENVTTPTKVAVEHLLLSNLFAVKIAPNVVAPLFDALGDLCGQKRYAQSP